jgi:hypothetical protein
MPFGLSTSTGSNVAASATAVTVFSASTTAVEARTVFNDSTAVLYLKKGASASTTDYWVQIPAGGYFEFPVGQSGPWPGLVSGIWSSTNGSARITEDS